MKKVLILALSLISFIKFHAQTSEAEIAKEDHAMLKIPNSKGLKLIKAPKEGQWFPKAGLGLFIHWGLSSVSGEHGLSWAMVPGRALKHKKISKEQIRVMLETKDFDMDGFADTLTGHKPRLGGITPFSYYNNNTKKFTAKAFNADKIIKEAAKAGFKYAVLTTKHHEGFALWPSDFGELSTKNYLNGRDLVGEYVKACRKYGLKVGLYFSGGDFHFANSNGRQNFMYWGAIKTNPDFPAIDENWNAFKMPPHDKDWQHKYDTFKVNQIKELLSRYGKIDLLWFDGNVPGWAYNELTALQPNILFNQRWSGPAHYDSGFENHLPKEQPSSWWEMCRTWQTLGWGYMKNMEYKSNAFILSELVRVKIWQGNYLLNVGPDGDGNLPEFAYTKMKEMAKWQKTNSEAILEIKPLPDGEKSNVIASRKGKTRYLFILPEFRSDKKSSKGQSMVDENLLPRKDQMISIEGITKPKHVKLLGCSKKLEYTYSSGTLNVKVPASIQTKLVDVIKIKL